MYRTDYEQLRIKIRSHWLIFVHTLFMTLVHDVVQIGPILTNLVPYESPERGLTIGTKFVKIGPICTKLGTNKVYVHVEYNHRFVEVFSS